METLEMSRLPQPIHRCHINLITNTLAFYTIYDTPFELYIHLMIPMQIHNNGERSQQRWFIYLHVS